MLRVVTLNTWKGDGAYAARLAAMTAGLASLSADIVALQEAFAGSDGGFDTAQHLARSLGMSATALPLRRKVRSVEGRSMDSTSGLAVLSRWSIRSHFSIGLTGDPRDGERGALIVDLEIGGRGVCVACVHLTHLDGADEMRRREWHEVESALTRTMPTIVAGDFNAPIEIFDLHRGRFIDSRQACGEPARPTTVDPALGCIDHVLFSRDAGLRPLRWATALGPSADGGVAASDHRAVVADFELG